MGFGSIDDFAKFFSDRFNIELSSFPRWSELREATYRRHVIIHNRAVTNDRYCKATGFKKRNVHIHTDITYCRSTGEALLEFVDFVHERIVAKLGLQGAKPGAKRVAH